MPVPLWAAFRIGVCMYVCMYNAVWATDYREAKTSGVKTQGRV